MDASFSGLACVAEQCVRERGEIEVLRKKLGGRDKVGNLQQPARLANRKTQGKFGLRFGKVLRSQKIVGERLDAEIQNKLAIVGIAGAALKGGLD